MAANPRSSRTADVVVIGGGLIGSSIALRLAQARLSVMVLDRGEPGAEASSAAAGMLAPQGETVEPDAFFEFCAASRDLYPRFVAEVEELSRQTVGYRSEGSLLVAIDENEYRKLEEIYLGQSRHGLTLEQLTATDVHARYSGLSPRVQRGLFIPGDHWVDNERLIQAVVEAGRQLGVMFHSHTPVTKLNVRGSRVESAEAATEATGAATAFAGAHYILAAGCWSPELMAPLGISLCIEPCRGQMIEFQSPMELPLVVRSRHSYLVPRSPQRVLAGTTVEYAGYEKAVTGEGLRSILEGTSRIVPLVNNLQFLRAWAGLRPDTADHLPILGYGGFDNLIFATGHFRNGILLAPLTAQLISELLLTRSTSLPIEAYRLGRFG